MPRRAQLPSYLRLERLEDGEVKAQWVCSCGHVEMGKNFPHVSEEGSNASVKCHGCGLTVRVTASLEQ